MASGDIVGIITGYGPTKTTLARGGAIEDASSPIGFFRTMAFSGSGSTVEHLDCTGYLDKNYTGNGLTLELLSTSSATAGSAVIQAAFLYADSSHVFTSAHTYSYQTVTIAAPAVAYTRTSGNITFTNGSQMDSLTANSPFVLRIKRDAAHASDNMAADFLLFYEWIIIRET